MYISSSLLLTPLSCGGGGGQGKLFTTLASELTERKILISSPEKSWFKIGSLEPYLEHHFPNVNPGMVVNIKLTIQTPGSGFKITGLGQDLSFSVVPNVTTPFDINIPIFTNTTQKYINIRGMEINTVLSDIKISITGNEVFQNLVVLRTPTTLLENIHYSPSVNNIIPTKMNLSKDLYTSGVIVKTDQGLSWNSGPENKQKTFGPVRIIPVEMQGGILMVRFKYSSNLPFAVRLWSLTGVNTDLSFPAGQNQDVFRDAYVKTKNDVIIATMSNFDYTGTWECVVQAADFSFTSINNDVKLKREFKGW